MAESGFSEPPNRRGLGPNGASVTGMVLAGGLARRMGGVDKGLQSWKGQALALHALRRLERQVDTVAVNANRHLDHYREWRVPVWEDEVAGHLGPLCGLLTGLVHMSTPWLVTVPCDVPRFPEDLVRRLVDAAERGGAELAVAAAADDDPGGVRDEAPRRHPVFCLIHRDLQDDLRQALLEGERRVDRWTQGRRRVVVPFPDARAFANLNTLSDLARESGGWAPEATGSAVSDLRG